MADYEDKTVDELQDELRNRDLPVSGTKAELIERLEENDNDPNPQNSSTEGDRSGKGTPPEFANEGGVTKEGTGDFAPGSEGSKLTVELGADGKNPVSPQNPPRKAMLGGGNAETNPDAVARNEGADLTSELTEDDDDVEVTETT